MRSVLVLHGSLDLLYWVVRFSPELNFELYGAEMVVPIVFIVLGGRIGIDDLALDPVRKMARIRDVLKAAPAVGDFLVLGERIGDQREGALIGLEGFRQRLRRSLALFRGAILQQRQRRHCSRVQLLCP